MRKAIGDIEGEKQSMLDNGILFILSDVLIHSNAM
jgi:hypothetical protein